MTLRFQTWRRAFAGSWLILLCFVGIILFREGPMGRVSEFLFWISGSLLIAFHLGVALLRVTGLLRFTYTEADRYSYLYHMKAVSYTHSEPTRP